DIMARVIQPTMTPDIWSQTVSIQCLHNRGTSIYECTIKVSALIGQTDATQVACLLSDRVQNKNRLYSITQHPKNIS
ncbi:hypothetical protein KKJ06_22305, partial [Xenorhabdus bovienii]|uniref:hypothetical protein n=1 Tax=Xenorhabdus bovienii TaxID=40576 RepID=UPI0023B32E4D